MPSQRAPFLFRAALLVFAALPALACKPGVGSKCDKGDARCLDGQRSLACENETFIEVPCRGKQGCSQQGELVSCDISANREGDRCSIDEQGSAVCKDGQTLLTCRGGKYVSLPCRGPNGCEREGAQSRCDRSVASLGDPCDTAATKACSTDSRQVLACEAGKMQLLLQCRGPRGCVAVGSKLDCDLSIAAEHDSCEAKLDGHVACTPDANAIVKCVNGRFELDEKCKAGKHCATAGTSTQCEAAK